MFQSKRLVGVVFILGSFSIIREGFGHAEAEVIDLDRSVAVHDVGGFVVGSNILNSGDSFWDAWIPKVTPNTASSFQRTATRSFRT